MLDHDSADIKSFLTKARDLQVRRLVGIFEKGFRLPKEFCEKYFLIYQGCNGNGKKIDPDIYKLLCESFWEEVEGLVNIPEELNNLDQATLFGEVCLGQHLGDK